MVQDYYGTCVQNYVPMRCRTDSDECRNGATMKDFGGHYTARCCCRCCRDGWCSLNEEDDDECRGPAANESSLRALMNVIRGEESMNQITNIDENTDGHTDGDFEMDQMHNA